jgi:hypothetical protein
MLMILKGFCCFKKISEVLLCAKTILVSSLLAGTGAMSFFSKLFEPYVDKTDARGVCWGLLRLDEALDLLLSE